MDRPGRQKDLSWLRHVSSFSASRIILTANNFRIFDHLTSSGKTARMLAAAISTDVRATELLLNSLVAIGLLDRKGGRYRNRPLAARYLVAGKTDYQGDILRHYSTLWDNWSGLDLVLRTGKPCRKSRDHESFILGMHNLALQKVKKVVALLDIQGAGKILDLGGGPGTYSMAFAKKGKDVVLMDFPETLKIAGRLIRKAGLTDRIRLMPGDFIRDDFGKGYELIYISQIFHAYDAAACISMLRKCHRALSPGGRVAVQEFFLDETRTAPPSGALFAINMLVNTPGGRTYTLKEMGSWLKKTGFAGVRNAFLDDAVLITAAKNRSV